MAAPSIDKLKPPVLQSSYFSSPPPSSPSSLPIATLRTHKFSRSFSSVPPSNPIGIRHHRNKPVATVSRRLLLPSVSGIWEALTGGSGGGNAREAALAIRRGMLLFRQHMLVLFDGDVVGSLLEFDKAMELDPRQKAHLWQRGLSLYYLNRFKEGAEQLRIDVAQNPNDTEESIWCFLCEAQLYGVDEARKRFLEVGRDPRPVMLEAYNLFKDGGDPEKLVAGFLDGWDSEYFYASLYAGLYYEAENKPEGAKRCIIAACQSPYGARSDDYMASLAKVHCLCRDWSST
ncbi:uncharacterized protein LOC104417708 [Eucalyptus grandis]|uniref:uncharacterized protein LOC104417708 n=1 Tax=Eucalyptus grandis TaxID=71139 RepID=UPI0005243268|nr:uncharacterized protein LOC104417708 [Eucalyptus grandis]